ncbi:MAG: DNA-binding transcriptional regulator Fis [Pseudomonadota bacterium]
MRATHANSKEPLRKCVREAVDNYFAQLDGHECQGLYRLVMSEVEAPLLESVMANAEGNQTLAAEMLGISRGTLRKKLREYGLT